MIKYVFKEDEPLAIKGADKADPQKIGEALEAVSSRNQGRLTPPDIVEAARDKKNVLHKHFEWDDHVAAESYRLEQARSIVRCIHIENTETDSGVARAFLSIREKTGVSYRQIGDILNSADLQQRVLAQAERDLISFENRYRSLEDICALVRSARERLSARRTNLESRDQAVA